MKLQQISIVLVEPSHPGNIGAAARALKTMGLTRLILVKPRLFPHEDASARAAGAEDVLDRAEVVDSLDQAIADTQLVIGTSVRDRQVVWPTIKPRQLPDLLQQNWQAHGEAEVAIVFGRERSGLTNTELDKTQWQLRIPANPDYGSLNLASAIQIVAYELYSALDSISDVAPVDDETEQTGAQQRQRLATRNELEGYYEHLQETLEQIGFVKTRPPIKLMRKIVRLYNRAQVSIEELQILRGMLTAIQDLLSSNPK